MDVLNNTALTGYRAPFLPGFGKHGDFGRCEFDTQKVLHVSGTYELPVGRDRRFLSNEGKVMNAILGGWDTNGILTLQDGQPGTVPCPITTTSGFGCNADKVPGQIFISGLHNVHQWLNPGAYANPPIALPLVNQISAHWAGGRAISADRDSIVWTSRCSSSLL